MNQIQVNIIKAEPFQTGIIRGKRRVISLISVPELGRYEYLFAGYATVADSLADARFITVDCSCIDQPVA